MQHNLIVNSTFTLVYIKKSKGLKTDTDYTLMHTEKKIKVCTVLWIILLVDYAKPLEVYGTDDNKGNFVFLDMSLIYINNNLN